MVHGLHECVHSILSILWMVTGRTCTVVQIVVKYCSLYSSIHSEQYCLLEIRHFPK